MRLWRVALAGFGGISRSVGLAAVDPACGIGDGCPLRLWTGGVILSGREIVVRVGLLPGRKGTYFASFYSEVLQATYSVEFVDNVMGGIALHGFAEMLRLKYGFRRVELVLEDQTLRFRSKAVVDALLSGSVETMPPVASLAG